MHTALLARLDRPLLGEGLSVREAGRVVVRRSSRLGDPSPNAPLLIRIVRYPISIGPGRGARVVYRERPEAVAEVDRDEERRLAAELRERAPTRSPAGRRPVPFVFRRGAPLPAPDREDGS